MAKLITINGKNVPISDEHIKETHKQVMIFEIEIEKDIPSFIYFEGEKLQINYQGQPQTCSVYQSLSHRAGECPTRRHPNSSPTYDQHFPRINQINTPVTQPNNPDPSR